jgi:hypothetical protein
MKKLLIVHFYDNLANFTPLFSMKFTIQFKKYYKIFIGGITIISISIPIYNKYFLSTINYHLFKKSSKSAFSFKFFNK